MLSHPPRETSSDDRHRSRHVSHVDTLPHLPWSLTGDVQCGHRRTLVRAMRWAGPMMRNIARAAILAVVIVAGSIAVGPRGRAPIIPQCPEDSVLVGTGAFDNGRWSAYVCGPAVDDYNGGKDS
jgi:hypothetical protein